MKNKFTAEIKYAKDDVIIYKEFYEKNINYVIDNLLISMKNEYVHLAIWSDPGMNIGEIIVLDSAFKQEQYIKITKIL
jgi:hypothetical protein